MAWTAQFCSDLFSILIGSPSQRSASSSTTGIAPRLPIPRGLHHFQPCLLSVFFFNAIHAVANNRPDPSAPALSRRCALASQGGRRSRWSRSAIPPTRIWGVLAVQRLHAGAGQPEVQFILFRWRAGGEGISRAALSTLRRGAAAGQRALFWIARSRPATTPSRQAASKLRRSPRRRPPGAAAAQRPEIPSAVARSAQQRPAGRPAGARTAPALQAKSSSIAQRHRP